MFILIGPNTFSARPHLAYLIPQIIAGWVQVEISLAETFGTYASLGPDVALSVYNAVDNFRAKQAMLDAAAKTVLNEEDLDLYSATMRFVKRRYVTRNEMAHWLWGYADDFPEALFIIDPVAASKVRMFYAGIRSLKDLPRIEPYRQEADSKTFIYRKRDLEEHSNEMFRAELAAGSLAALRWPVPGPGPTEYVGPPVIDHRQKLLKEPEIAQDYHRLRSKAVSGESA